MDDTHQPRLRYLVNKAADTLTDEKGLFGLVYVTRDLHADICVVTPDGATNSEIYRELEKLREALARTMHDLTSQTEPMGHCDTRSLGIVNV